MTERSPDSRRPGTRFVETVAALLTLTPLTIVSQTPAAPALPAYDVVTIKPSNRGPGSWGIDVKQNTLSAGNVTLKSLLEQAYDIRTDLIYGIPGQLESVRFEMPSEN